VGMSVRSVNFILPQLRAECGRVNELASRQGPRDPLSCFCLCLGAAVPRTGREREREREKEREWHKREGGALMERRPRKMRGRGSAHTDAKIAPDYSSLFPLNGAILKLCVAHLSLTSLMNPRSSLLADFR
jgi:hypothetical protein